MEAFPSYAPNYLVHKKKKITLGIPDLSAWDYMMHDTVFPEGAHISDWFINLCLL